MDFNYRLNDIAQGNRNKLQSEETPNSFGETAGAATVSPTGDLAKRGQRMAGPVGARAVELAENPEEKKRTENWMKSFGLTNEGAVFNQARLGVPEGTETTEPSKPAAQANETKQPETETKPVTPEPKVKEEMK